MLSCELPEHQSKAMSVTPCSFRFHPLPPLHRGTTVQAEFMTRDSETPVSSSWIGWRMQISMSTIKRRNQRLTRIITIIWDNGCGTTDMNVAGRSIVLYVFHLCGESAKIPQQKSRKQHAKQRR